MRAPRFLGFSESSATENLTPGSSQLTHNFGVGIGFLKRCLAQIRHQLSQNAPVKAFFRYPV